MANLRCQSRAFFLLGILAASLTAGAAETAVVTYSDKPCTFSLVSSSESDSQACDTWDDTWVGQWYGEGTFALYSYESLRAEKTGYTATWYTYPSQRKSAFEEGAAHATKRIGTGDTLSEATLQANAALTYSYSNRRAVYVRWTPITYSIAFDGGDAMEGNMPSIQCTYDVPVILPQCEFTRKGFDFVGWATSPGGSAVYKDRESVQNLTAIAGEEVTLYATWQISEYTVTLDDTGGVGGSGTVIAQYGANMPSANLPERYGYAFLGYWDHTGKTNEWVQYYNSDMQSQRVWELERDTTLYAHWKQTLFTVTLDDTGGAGGPGAVTVESGENMPSATAPTRFGYAFLGYWDHTGNEADWVQYYNADMQSQHTWEKDRDATLYAHWKRTTYTVTFDDAGGTGGSDSVAVQLGANMPAARTPSRLGYIFFGYWDHNGKTNEWVQYYDANMYSQRTWELERDTTLYAHWKPITYTLTLDGNGADSSSGPTNYVCTYDVDPQIDTHFEKEGVEFRGWGISRRTVKYQPEDKLINLTTIDKSKIKLYAIWSTNAAPEVVTSDLAKALGLVGIEVTGDQWQVDQEIFAPGSAGSSSVRYVDLEICKPLEIYITRPGTVTFWYKGTWDTGDKKEALQAGTNLLTVSSNNWVQSPLLAVSKGKFSIMPPILLSSDKVWVDDFTFTPSSHDIEIVADVGGKVSDGTTAGRGSSLVRTVDRGSDVTIQAEPDPGYEFSAWDWNGASVVTSTVTFKAEEDVSAVAYFKPLAPELTLTNDATGVKLAWTKIAWADQYVLYRSTGTQQPTKPFQVFNSLKTDYTDTEASAESVYSYWLEARSGAQTTCSPRVSVGISGESTLESLSLSAAKTTLKSGEKTTCLCTAVYTDKSTRVLAPTWSVVSGSTYAIITSAGEVTVNNTTLQQQVVTIRAVYQEDDVAYEGTLKLIVTPTTTRTDGKYEVTVTCDATRGTVTGGGAYAAGKTITVRATTKTGYLFSGWFNDAGTLLSQSTTYRYKVTKEDVILEARFTTALELMGDVSVTAGDVVFSAENLVSSVSVSAAVPVSWEVAVDAEAQAKLTVTGLPAGLRYANGQIVGVPTRGGKTSVVKLTLKIGKLSQVFVLNVTVDALPSYAVGNFTGGATDNDAGSATLKVTTAGRITGKWISEGKTWTLSANAFSDGDLETGVYYADLTAKCGKETQPLLLTIEKTGIAQTELFEALWSNWTVNPWKSILKSSVKGVTDKIALTDGVIDVKFLTTGSATVKGTFGSYKPAASAVLSPVDGQEDVFALFVYFPPKTTRTINFPGYAGWFTYVIEDGKLVRADAE